MTAEIALADAGVFAGLGGLRGLTECDEFWARQPYGTRLYYVPRRSEYLHRTYCAAQSSVLTLDKV